MFAGTEDGLYRLDSDIWEKLPLDTSGAVCSLAVSGHNIYAGIGHQLLVTLTPVEINEVMRDNKWHFAKIFHSADLGASWTEIWHKSQYLPTGPPAGITVLAAGPDTLGIGTRAISFNRWWTNLDTTGKRSKFLEEKPPSSCDSQRENVLQSQRIRHSSHD